MNKLKLIHLFSGVGAPEMALKRLGIPLEIVGFSEIDKYAIQAYKAIHGDIPNLGDIKHIERLPKVNLVVYGSPCQDFSIAGKQRGLINEQGEQTRSGLLLEVERLIETAKANNELPEILLMENVKNLVSKKFKPDFDRWLQKLDEVGYNNYWQVLNAKDFGVPQNRERVFVLSLRKDIDKRGYNFPKEMQLLKRLKDVLETEVEDKYYLSDKAIEGFLKHNENHLAKGTGFLWKPRDLDGYASCLRANGALCPTDNTIQESVFLLNKGTELEKTTDVACTLLARDYKGLGNYRGNGVIEYNIAAQRGRYVEGDSGETEQRLEINSQGLSNTLTTVQKDNLVVESYDTPLRLGNIYGREKGTSFAGNVYDKNAISPTLNTMQGGNRQPMIVDDTIHKIDIPQTVRVRKYDVDNEKLVNLLRNHKTLTNKQIAESLDVPLTKVEHWFRTDIHFAIPDAEIWYQLKELLGITTNEFDEAIMTFEEREGVYEKSNRCYLDSGVAPTLTTLSGKEKVITDFRIRRLTPLECWRLMDFSDEDFNKAKASGLSNTQLYKIAGNSIVVNVLYHIFRKLFIDFNEVKSSE
jgi:DNA (cytosine-5)-methyltransferase 1